MGRRHGGEVGEVSAPEVPEPAWVALLALAAPLSWRAMCARVAM